MSRRAGVYFTGWQEAPRQIVHATNTETEQRTKSRGARERRRVIVLRGMGKKAFAQIDKGKFLKELRERVKDPKLTNQGELSFCGPAAILHALAKDSPVEYATFALDLFLSGKRRLFGVRFHRLAQQQIARSMIGDRQWIAVAFVTEHELTRTM